MSPLNITQPLDSIRYMVYNGYYKVMSNIPKMGHLPTPDLVHQRWTKILCNGYMFSSSKNGHVFFQGFDMDLIGEMWSHEIDVPGIKLDM